MEFLCYNIWERGGADEPHIVGEIGKVTEEVIQVKKSNSLISSIGHTTLLGSKVMLAALVYVEDRDERTVALSKDDKEYYKGLQETSHVDYTKGLVAEFSDAQLRRILYQDGKKSGSYYKTIYYLLNSKGPDSFRNQWQVNVKNSRTGLYGYTEIITGCLYDEQHHRMFIKFSGEEDIRKLIYELKSNYTLLNYNLMMRFKSLYSYRIYELMLSRIGYQNGTSHTIQEVYRFNYNLSELKFILGILDADDKSISIQIQEKNPDFEALERKLAENAEKRNESVRMPRYIDFKKNVLKVAADEINSMSELDWEFDYEEVRKGRGGKVVSVDLIFKCKAFMVDEPKDKEKAEQPSKVEKTEPVDKDEVFFKACRMLEGTLEPKDVRSICEKAEYSIVRIEKAFEVLQATPNVNNICGFLIKAIEGNYQTPIPKHDKPKNDFNNFKQNSYDYDEVERILVSN